MCPYGIRSVTPQYVQPTVEFGRHRRAARSAMRIQRVKTLPPTSRRTSFRFQSKSACITNLVIRPSANGGSLHEKTSIAASSPPEEVAQGTTQRDQHHDNL